MPQQFDLLKASAITQIQSDLEGAVEADRILAQTAATTATTQAGNAATSASEAGLFRDETEALVAFGNASYASTFPTNDTETAALDSPFLFIAPEGVQSWTHTGTFASLAQGPYASKVRFDTVALLLASEVAIPNGTIVHAGGFRYEVVTTGEHVTTAGGEKLRVLPLAGVVYCDAFNIVKDDPTAENDTALLDAITLGMNGGHDIVLPSGLFYSSRVYITATGSISIRGYAESTHWRAKSGRAVGQDHFRIIGPSDNSRLYNVTLRDFKIDGNAEANPIAMEVISSDGFIVGETIETPAGRSAVIQTIPNSTTLGVKINSTIAPDDIIIGQTSAASTTSVSGASRFSTSQAHNLRIGQTDAKFNKLIVENVTVVDPMADGFSCPASFLHASITNLRDEGGTPRTRESLLFNGDFREVFLSKLNIDSLSFETASIGNIDQSIATRLITLSDSRVRRFDTTVSIPDILIPFLITNCELRSLGSFSNTATVITASTLYLRGNHRLSKNSLRKGTFKIVDSDIRLLDSTDEYYIRMFGTNSGPELEICDCNISYEGTGPVAPVFLQAERYGRYIRVEGNTFTFPPGIQPFRLQFPVNFDDTREAVFDDNTFDWNPPEGASALERACIRVTRADTPTELTADRYIQVSNNRVLGSRARLLAPHSTNPSDPVNYHMSGNKHLMGGALLVDNGSNVSMTLRSAAPFGSGSGYVWRELDILEGLVPPTIGPVIKGQRFRVLGAGPADVHEFAAEDTRNGGSAITWVPVVVGPNWTP